MLKLAHLAESSNTTSAWLPKLASLFVTLHSLGRNASLDALLVSLIEATPLHRASATLYGAFVLPVDCH